MNISWRAINNSVGFGRSESDYWDDVGRLCKAELQEAQPSTYGIRGILANGTTFPQKIPSQSLFVQAGGDKHIPVVHL